MKLKLALTLLAAAAIVGMATTKSNANGMIIPAYLPLTDTNDWNILAADALIMKSGTNANYKDYWITVNSSNNGPFTASSDWTTAATEWNPIRANGGKIFGYVHTITSPTSSTFRSLCSVEADITSWVNGYGNLDGIWIDEYYPRYEIAPATGSTATFPNGTALAPYNLNFLNADGTFNANQAMPDGGYYSQLISWIRTTYPKLRIIGNAGGWFYSNQTYYADLPNVTCSFEQTYAYAANSPTNNWTGLNRQNTTSWRGQLALIHTNSTDLAGAIDQAISHGYTHFYTTNGTLSNNIWGAIPPYFTTEVQYIANHS